MPEKLSVVWEVPLASAGLGGIAANHQYVIFGDRDDDDFHDVYRCLSAESGENIWDVQRLAVAALDYGNSPRATPLIAGDHVFCQGAHGHLLCIRISDGQVLWERNFRDDFPITGELPWGYCASPLLAGGKLVVAPGSPDASVVALDPGSGEILWRSPGHLPGHGSLIAASPGGVDQIIGHDKTSLGGWSIDTGERLWTIDPVSDGDFNVPTPIIQNVESGQTELFVATENNGIRGFRFDSAGAALAEPTAHSHKLRTDMSTPTVVGSRIYCVKDFLFCLNASDLSEQWRVRDRALGDYAAILWTADRLLIIGKGELLLMGTDGEQDFISRQRIFEENQVIYSHPALVDGRLYIRGEHRLRCISLKGS